MSIIPGKVRRQSLPDLPAWLEALLPEPQEPIVMSVADAGRLRLRFPDGRVEQFDTLRAAHEATLRTDWDLFIEDHVYDVFGDRSGELRRLWLGYPSDDGKGYTTMVMSYTDDDRHASLQEDYRDFLEITEAYASNPDDFYAAWRFIDTHPAFWTAPDLDEHPWHWNTYGYCNRMCQSVWKKDEELVRGSVGTAMVSLSAGGHVPEDEQRGTRYRDHYADWRLEVTARTFEKAVVLLAERVSLCFEDDGSPKSENTIPLEEPEWVSTLKSRFANLDDDSGRSDIVKDPRDPVY